MQMAAKVEGGDELAPFLIKNVKGLEECADKEEKQAGFGAYGFVFKVNVNGVERIAKRIHGAYVKRVSAREKQGITSKFRAESIILSKLRHPNIVQFVGVHYGRGGMTDLTLFMECLSSDMDDFLSTRPNLPLSLKLSLLQDVSFGLVYLHEYKPPVVHRDLTARNILISDRCQAKIADLGMAKIVDIQAQLAKSHTTVPGQQFYMPPEALKEKASCTPKLDIFSFGHLALYTVIQELPEVYEITEESLMMKILKKGTVQKEKRKKSIDTVGKGHCLYPIISDCLFDNPDQRPTTRDLNSRLCLLATQNPEASCSKSNCKSNAKEVKQLRETVLEIEAEKLANPVPANVYHFCLQLSKLVDPEGESAETASRPIVVQDIIPLLQAMGCGVEFKPKGYVIALFHAFNQSQSILLDYTQIGEVVQLKGPDEYLDISDSGEEAEESPYSSLNEVRVAVTEGNMTDADKLELEQMLRESQDELEKLRVKNKNLSDHLTESQEQLEELQVARGNLMESQERLQAENKNLTERLEEFSAPKPAGGVQPSGHEVKAFKDLKAKYLQLVDEKMKLTPERDQLLAEKKQLLEKLADRDIELKQLREDILPERDDRPPVSHPDVEQSLSTGDLSPDDPKAEIRKLRKVIKEKDVKMEMMDVQLRSFDAVASTKTSLEKEIAQMKMQLEAAQAEIKALSDRSELIQVYNSLRAEVARTREDMRNSEERAADAESEKEVLQNEISAERDNNQSLQSEVVRLTAALHFYKTKYPQGDEEGLVRLSDGSMQPEQDGEIVEQLKAEITDLQTEISQKEAAVLSLTKSRRTVESRYQRLQEERDRLAEQIVSLIAVRDNLKGDTVKVREYASQLQQNVLAKETEAEGWRREKEEMMKEIQDLQDDVGARRQEITILRKDFEEILKVDESNKPKKWRAQEQRYHEQLQNFDRQLKQLKHDSEQKVKHLTHEADLRVVKLTIKLYQKVDELKRVTGSAVERQREFDALCDQLRHEQDSVQTERDRYKDERDTWCMEYNKGLTMYEEKMKQHKAEVDKINEELDLWKTKCATFDDHVREMEVEARKKEKECELTASSNRQLKSQLQEVAHQLNTEKEEKKELSANLAALDHQLRLKRDRWLTDKSNMERVIADMSKQMQELQQVHGQADILRGRGQGEWKKVQQLERELQSSQELLQKLEEEHKSDIEYVKAKCEGEKLELERKLTPLRRELELLRTQTFHDSKFSETYRRMDAERKELRENMQQLREELQTLQVKYDKMVDDYTVARDYILQNNLPLPKRKVGVQYCIQTQPAQMSQSTYLRSPEEIKVRPYLGEKPTYPPTSEGYSSQRFRHLGEDRPPPVPHPQDNQRDYKQKMLSNSRLERQGSTDYGPNQKPHQALPNNKSHDSTSPTSPGVQQKPKYHPPAKANCKPPSKRPMKPPAPAPMQEDVLLMGIDQDISEAAAKVREEVFTFMLSVEGKKLLKPIETGRLGITHEIKEMADYVRAEVSEDNEQLKTMEHLPYDPNLVCPMCKKLFRIGEIQKYRKHVDTCDGDVDADEHMYR